MSIIEENADVIVTAIEACGLKNSIITVDESNERVEIEFSNGETLMVEGIGTQETLPELLFRIMEKLEPRIIDARLGLGPTVSRLTKENGASAKDSIVRPPGMIVLKGAKFVYSRKKYERVLLPTITDMREEYCEALLSGELLKARWIHLQGLWAFWAAVLTDIPISVFGLVKKLWTTAS